MADSYAWQTHLPNATADDTSLLNQAHVRYQSGTGGSTVEKPTETHTSIRLASRLVRVPISRPGGHDFESPMGRELSALTKSGKTGQGSGHSTVSVFVLFVTFSPFKIDQQFTGDF